MKIKEKSPDCTWVVDDKDIFISTKNDGLIVTKKGKIIKALEKEEEAEKDTRLLELLKERDELKFKILISELSTWIEKHKVHEAFLTMGDSDLLFLVTTKNDGFDEQLENDLYELAMDISSIKALKSLRISTLCLPPKATNTLEKFLSPTFCLKYEPKRRAS